MDLDGLIPRIQRTSLIPFVSDGSREVRGVVLVSGCNYWTSGSMNRRNLPRRRCAAPPGRMKMKKEDLDGLGSSTSDIPPQGSPRQLHAFRTLVIRQREPSAISAWCVIRPGQPVCVRPLRRDGDYTSKGIPSELSRQTDRVSGVLSVHAVCLKQRALCSVYRSQADEGEHGTCSQRYR